LVSELWTAGRDWLWSAAILATAVLAALVVHRLVDSAATRLSRRTRSILDGSLVKHSRGPARLLMVLAALFLALPVTPLPAAIAGRIQHGAGIGVIAAVAWLLVALTNVVDDFIESRYDVTVADNLAARQVRTRTQVFRRLVVVVVGVVATGLILMTFPAIRRFGTSLLASAGVAGIILGLAARETISNLLAGVQVALTEPIRLDDVVIVEGEWGRVEEIRMSYVVVRIWDERRLVVPLSYFIEKPFQNWTRSTAHLLGTVVLHVDYTLPVDGVREELHRILEASKLWDGKVWNLQVTDASERTMQLRALMSAPDASTAWDLRCHVRERLIEYLQRQHPESLPRVRAELRRDAAPDEHRGLEQGEELGSS
jgi:small-conductance mechanosensitive channel